ncbi:MAG: thioredoxin [Clostridiaceae bacterium]|nr:thioredoxin [Clostridiaceae bacterium]
MGNSVLTVTKENFDQEVLQSEQPVMVDFWAAWCGPCRMVAPTVEQVAEEFQGKAKVVKVNVDDNGELAERYRIMTIPTLMVFKNGNVVDSLVGVRTKEELSNMLNKHL